MGLSLSLGDWAPSALEGGRGGGGEDGVGERTAGGGGTGRGSGVGLVHPVAEG